MKYVRFMGVLELEKYVKGETLKNDTVWRRKAQCTDSVGFCFFDTSATPESRIEYLNGVVDLSCVVVFEAVEGKKLTKSKGRYRDPARDDSNSLLPPMMSVTEYSTTEYSLRDMRAVKIGAIEGGLLKPWIKWLYEAK